MIRKHQNGMISETKKSGHYIFLEIRVNDKLFPFQFKNSINGKVKEHLEIVEQISNLCNWLEFHNIEKETRDSIMWKQVHPLIYKYKR